MKSRLLILCLPFILFLNSFGQEITPLSEIYISDDLFCDKWCYQDGDENLRFFTLADGEMWAFKSSGTDEDNYVLRSYVYNTDEESYFFDFMEKMVDLSDHTYTYPPVAFSVNGENFVYTYYKSTENKPMDDACDYKPYYYRLLHQSDPPEGEWLTSVGPVEMQHGPLHDTDPNKPIYRSAWVDGDRVYLLYDSYISLSLVDVGITECLHGQEWQTKTIYYDDNSVYVDICEVTSDHNLTRLSRQRIENVMHSSEQHPQHLSGMRVGEDLILLISYDDGYTGDHVHRGGGVLAYNVTEGEKIEDRYFSGARMLRAVEGSIQGEGEDEGFGNTTRSARFQVFFNRLDDSSPDEVITAVKTYAIEEDNGEYDVMEQSENSREIEGLTNPGDGWGDLMMDVAVRREAKEGSDLVPGNERVEQYIYLFRNDADKEVRAHKFNSDIFSLNFSDSAYVESRNFGPAYDDLYDGINRRLWSLVGIYEGAPPMPMNWERYKEQFPDKNATGITVSNETENVLSLTETSDFGIYGKIGAEFSEELIYGSIKLARNWINSHSVSHTVKYSQDINSVLNNGSMGKGVFLWSVPNLARADMSRFPWWAADDSQKVPGSETSVIWHLAPNNNLVFEVVDMGDELYAPLFGIDAENYYPLSEEDSLNTHGEYLNSAGLDSLTFERWCDEWTITNASRINLSEKATEHTGTHVLDFVWDAGGTDATSSFSQTDVSSSTTGGSSSVEITVGTKLGNARVFSLNLEAGASYTYSQESTQSFSASSGYKLYTDKALEGTKITDEYVVLTEKLALSCYLFNDPDADYWYYDVLHSDIGDTYPEFKNQKPWYLGYVASRPEPYIHENATATEQNLIPQFAAIRYAPDHSAVLISYTLETAVSSNSSIYIIDVLGRPLKNLAVNTTPGTHTLQWDCTGEQGVRVPGGMYFVVMNTDGHTIGEPVLVQ